VTGAALLIITIWVLLIQYYFFLSDKDTEAKIREIDEKINILSDQQVNLMEQIKEMREEHYDISGQQIKAEKVYSADNSELH
jgi:uncharacterized membrane protein